MQYLRLWIALALVIVGSFVVLGSVGVRAVTQAPPTAAGRQCGWAGAL